MEGITRIQDRHIKRKQALNTIKKFIIVLVIAAVGIILYDATHPRLDIVATKTYFVTSGDTLWDIAEENVPDSMDIRIYIDTLFELNDGLTTDVKCGQAILLPMYETQEHNAVKAAGLKARYTSLGVPNINSSCKRWMDYRCVTNKNSPQYKFIKQYGWSDSEGFMRCSGEADLGINDDYYLIALGSYYGKTIGTKYKITTNTGSVFYGVLADLKADRHTNSTHQYTSKKNPDIVEFLVDTKKLNKEVKRMGSANVYMPLNGSIAKIERIDFVDGE